MRTPAQRPLVPIPLQPEVRCARCGESLNSKLHEDTPAGPACLGGCPPRERQPSLF